MFWTPWLQDSLSLCHSQSYIATDGRSISKSWCRAPSGAHDQIFIIVRQLRSCFCGASSLSRGRVCLYVYIYICVCHWHGPHRKVHFQQLLYYCLLQSRYLARLFLCLHSSCFEQLCHNIIISCFGLMEIPLDVCLSMISMFILQGNRPRNFMFQFPPPLENNHTSCCSYEPAIVSHDAYTYRDCDIRFCSSVFRRACNPAERLLNSHRPPTRPLISLSTSEKENRRNFLKI
jgi:hypothetical protein